jgi:hypothetical protein
MIIIFLLTLLIGLQQATPAQQPSIPTVDDLAESELRTAQRDTQYRSDVGRIAAALENYAANNNGSYPIDLEAVVDDGLIDQEDIYFDLDELQYELDGRRYELSVQLPGGETYTLDNL